jgi:hypothetical protein
VSRQRLLMAGARQGLDSHYGQVTYMTDIDRIMMGEECIRIFIRLSLPWVEKVMVLRGLRDPMWFSSPKLAPSALRFKGTTAG